MKIRTLMAGVAVVLAGCAGMQMGSDGGWTTLYDGKSLAGWNRVGDAKNGVKTADGHDAKHPAAGYIGLQLDAVGKQKGAIKFRKVEIRPL
ncbi:MAG TPA: hypothetical protein VLH12_15035 [Usitatibacter sp.]|nr:hypothetical protein [Usitatibacter sp.]